MRALREGGLRTSPLTREAIAGYVLLQPSHFAATAASLARALSGGKYWGVPALWLANVYLAVARGLRRHLDGALESLAACLRGVLRDTDTYACLCGLSNLPTFRAPVAAAIWLVLHSPEHSYPDGASPLKRLLPALDELLALAEALDVPVSPDARLHAERLWLLASMRAWRRGRTPAGARAYGDEVLRLDNLLSARGRLRCWRCPLTVEELPPGLPAVEFVPLDGPAEPSQRELADARLPPRYLDYERRRGEGELLALAELSRDGGEPAMGATLAPRAPAEAARCWPYETRLYPSTLVPVCAATARPWTEPGGEPWEAAAERVYGVRAGRMISVHEHFGNFVARHKVYPDENVLILSLWAKHVRSGKRRALPYSIETFAREVVDAARPLTSQISPEEFARRFAASCAKVERLRIERLER